MEFSMAQGTRWRDVLYQCRDGRDARSGAPRHTTSLHCSQAHFSRCDPSDQATLARGDRIFAHHPTEDPPEPSASQGEPPAPPSTLLVGSIPSGMSSYVGLRSEILREAMETDDSDDESYVPSEPDRISGRRPAPRGLPLHSKRVHTIAKKRKGGIRITARVASCAKSLCKHNNKENIIGLAQTLGIATVRRFHHGDGKRMMSRHSLQRIAVLLAEKLTGE